MKIRLFIFLSVALAFSGASAQTEGDAEAGARLFRQCAACHSLNPGEHLTGPSLAGVVGRKAGTAKGFHRYSPAILESGVRWNRETLDAWLRSPTTFLPGTNMQVPGIDDPSARGHIIAYLESAGSPASQGDSGAPGMPGMMARSRMANLKEQSPSQRVTAIRHCKDAYQVTLGTGRTFTFWEFNLRFKTDSSDNGPPKGQPGILRGGMMGDRAFIVFSEPAEISGFIKSGC